MEIKLRDGTVQSVGYGYGQRLIQQGRAVVTDAEPQKAKRKKPKPEPAAAPEGESSDAAVSTDI